MKWIGSVDKGTGTVDPWSHKAAGGHLLAHLQNVRLHIPGIQNRRDTGVEQCIQVSLEAEHVTVWAPTPHQVHVHVREPWHDGLSSDIDDLCARWHSNS